MNAATRNATVAAILAARPVVARPTGYDSESMAHYLRNAQTFLVFAPIPKSELVCFVACTCDTVPERVGIGPHTLRLNRDDARAVYASLSERAEGRGNVAAAAWAFELSQIRREGVQTLSGATEPASSPDGDDDTPEALETASGAHSASDGDNSWKGSDGSESDGSGDQPDPSPVCCTVEAIEHRFSNPPTRHPIALARLDCGNYARVEFTPEAFTCSGCGTVYVPARDSDGRRLGCPECGGRGWKGSMRNEHDPEQQITKPGDVVECRECTIYRAQLAKLRALDFSTVSHVRWRGHGSRAYQKGSLYVYARDPRSPSGVQLVAQVYARPEAEALLREHRLSALSPTEGLAVR